MNLPLSSFYLYLYLYLFCLLSLIILIYYLYFNFIISYEKQGVTLKKQKENPK